MDVAQVVTAPAAALLVIGRSCFFRPTTANLDTEVVDDTGQIGQQS